MLAARKLGSFALLFSPFVLFASEALARHGSPWRFEVEETTIEEIHEAILARRLTATQLVNLYLERIKAHNGTCVNEPEITTSRCTSASAATPRSGRWTSSC